MCADCAHKKQRKVERPDKNELITLLENNSISAIGRKYNVSFQTIKKWMKYYKI